MSNQHEHFEDLENALRQLPLRSPSAGMDQRLIAAIEAPRHGMWRLGIIGGALAAAAMVLVVLWATARVDTGGRPELIASTAPAVHDTVAITQSIQGWVDDGVVGYTTDGPVRQYRVQTVEEFASADGEPRTITQESVVQYVADTY